MIIGLTGTIGAGKSLAALYIKSKGVEHLTYSNVIREEAKKRGIEPTRNNLQWLGNQMRKEAGDSGILSKVLLDKIKTDKALLDGIRNLKEFEYLRQREDFFLVGIDAEQKIRFKRLKSRAREGDPKTFSDFKIIDDKENLGNESGQEIRKCLVKADFIVLNNTSEQDMWIKIDVILENIAERV